MDFSEFILIKVHNKRQSDDVTGPICIFIKILIKISIDIPFPLTNEIGYAWVHTNNWKIIV